ncbi:uncharacterized protein FOMMEDRAFT_162782 [Fomitiporia mediterranea MF3/22]|uniref:Uncharacterized protein n=1 Tax=Fomitiporia mediterranea (strain MF3/22) TaxID=694068 RepID=R7SFV2_FOMME|nr:uncharacterized protein FOMMEDRAFT_162782 [Fomitiporia mediterranea MF3/22]EJC97601.1 hypothetical protein FOMMEDRAFT_162782 [Fomitiporia mediterranea MF3/22]
MASSFTLRILFFTVSMPMAPYRMDLVLHRVDGLCVYLANLTFDRVRCQWPHTEWILFFTVSTDSAYTSGVHSPLNPPPPPPSPDVPANQRPEAWNILREYAQGDIGTVPELERHLQDCLGEDYEPGDWLEVINAVLDTEDDVPAAVHVVEQLAPQPVHQPAVAYSPSQSSTGTTTLEQLHEVEEDLLFTVNELHHRRRIIGAPLSLEDLLNPAEEKKEHPELDRLKGFGDLEIIEEVRRRIDRGINLEDTGDESDSEPETPVDEPVRKVSLRDGQDFCILLEQLTLEHAEVGVALSLTNSLRKFRARFYLAFSVSRVTSSSLHSTFASIRLISHKPRYPFLPDQPERFALLLAILIFAYRLHCERTRPFIFPYVQDVAQEAVSIGLHFKRDSGEISERPSAPGSSGHLKHTTQTQNMYDFKDVAIRQTHVVQASPVPSQSFLPSLPPISDPPNLILKALPADICAIQVVAKDV